MVHRSGKAEKHAIVMGFFHLAFLAFYIKFRAKDDVCILYLKCVTCWIQLWGLVKRFYTCHWKPGNVMGFFPYIAVNDDLRYSYHLILTFSTHKIQKLLYQFHWTMYYDFSVELQVA